MNDLIELHAIVSGHVQGVFFRATACNHAKELALFGTVKNLKDGTVEIYAQGTKQQLDAFLKKVKENPGMGRVDLIESSFSKPTRELSLFRAVR